MYFEESKKSACIKLFAMLELIVLPLIKESHATTSSKEDKKLIKRANRWMNQLANYNNISVITSVIMLL